MKIKTLSAIVVCSVLLLVQGLDGYKYGTVNPSHRIINGEIADPEDFRFLVFMVIKAGWRLRRCGGSIISKHFILTAAHCIYDNVCETIKIFPSTWAIGDKTDLHPINCRSHEAFNGHEYNNDIAIVETAEDLIADDRFAMIDLPPADMTYGPDDTGIIVGWGGIERGSTAVYLKYSEVPVYSWNECKSVYEIAERCAEYMFCPVAQFPENAFCTLSYPQNSSSACVGDTGGPVIIDGMVAGVISGIILSTTRHCDVTAPGLNQDVATFVPWILDNIESDQDTYY